MPEMNNSKDAASAMAEIILAVADGEVTPDEAGNLRSARSDDTDGNVVSAYFLASQDTCR
jgi:hypothetical protein|tara:strand:+ start:448 stop:627 length:180 start_codon:yes stop_codon:yes gene_type:complete